MTFYGKRRRHYRRSDPTKFEKAVEMRNNPTPSEAKMYNILYAEVVPKYPQHIFYRQSVKFGYILDFYCPTLHLGIEVDGGVHSEQKRYDTKRDNRLRTHGIHIFRFSNDDVLYNSQAVASDICQIVEARSSNRGFITTPQFPTNDSQRQTTATTLQNKRACFIATAAYGTPMAKEIQTLRSFRDSRLETNCIGRNMVVMYYNLSPRLANVIAKSEKMKALVRFILKPIIQFSKNKRAHSVQQRIKFELPAQPHREKLT